MALKVQRTRRHFFSDVYARRPRPGIMELKKQRRRWWRKCHLKSEVALPET